MFFFFKQKTAYEMRISDWSSDVCSSDLLGLGARVFRLPGIYGPGRSPLDRVRAGNAHRVVAPGQVFSRIHVDDIASGVIAAFDGPSGAYNLADDMPAPQNEVVAFAARLLGVAQPEVIPCARHSRSEERRVGKEGFRTCKSR